MISDEILNRKGATRISAIPPQVLELLHKGLIPTVHLTEWLALDQHELIRHTFPAIGIPETQSNQLIAALQEQKKASAMSNIRLTGNWLYAQYAGDPAYPALLLALSSHQADLLRCYSVYLIALNNRLTLAEKLAALQPLAADPHFGVREVAWMAIRPFIEQELVAGINLLSQWATDHNDYIRRFACEVIRPRGVWCQHIALLKEQPGLALPVLNALKADPSVYVQDSVGNWLNDAGKSQPAFVTALCARWERESPGKTTQRIIKKALRSISGQTQP